MDVFEPVCTSILVREGCAKPSLDIAHLEPKRLDRARRGDKLLHLFHRASHIVDGIFQILEAVFEDGGWVVAVISVLEVRDKVESVVESEGDCYACEAVRVILDGVGKRGES